LPIRPENKKLYPADWKQISLRIRKERAGDKCEWCGAENGKPHPITGSKVVLTVAHLNHAPSDCSERNLVALCQRDHLRYDAEHHRQTREATRRAKMATLELFPSMSE
jgi:hypothetical protein